MGLFILARIAGEAVALSAESVGSVVEIGRITPVPRAAPHVLGLCALRSRVLTVICSASALGEAPSMADALLAVTLDVEGHAYALVVEAVEDVFEAPGADPAGAALAPRWLPFARGVVTHADVTALLVDAAALVAGRPAVAPGSANRTVTALH